MQMVLVHKLDHRLGSQETSTMAPLMRLTTKREHQRQSRTKHTKIVKEGHQGTPTAALHQGRQRRWAGQWRTASKRVQRSDELLLVHQLEQLRQSGARAPKGKAIRMIWTAHPPEAQEQLDSQATEPNSAHSHPPEGHCMILSRATARSSSACTLSSRGSATAEGAVSVP